MTLESPLGAHPGDYHTTRINDFFGGNINAEAGSSMRCRDCDKALDRDRVEPGRARGHCVNPSCPEYLVALQIFSDGSRGRV